VFNDAFYNAMRIMRPDLVEKLSKELATSKKVYYGMKSLQEQWMDKANNLEVDKQVLQHAVAYTTGKSAHIPQGLTERMEMRAKNQDNAAVQKKVRQVRKKTAHALTVGAYMAPDVLREILAPTFKLPLTGPATPNTPVLTLPGPANWTPQAPKSRPMIEPPPSPPASIAQGLSSTTEALQSPATAQQQLVITALQATKAQLEAQHAQVQMQLQQQLQAQLGSPTNEEEYAEVTEPLPTKKGRKPRAPAKKQPTPRISALDRAVANCRNGPALRKKKAI
jgi:hypothetical protein